MDELAKTPTEATLKKAVYDLVELSWQLNGAIFGERPQEANKEVSAQNGLLDLRNKVLEANARIRETIKALSQLK